MKSNNLISISNLTVTLNYKEILKEVTFDINRNDFIGVIGPNGGGKTTLVKAILKTIPYTGDISYSPTIESCGFRKIGYLPQISNLDKSFPISVQDIILSGLQAKKKLLGRYSAADYSKAEELLELTGIKRLKNRAVRQLSGGEFQRVMLCRALISDPELLILDEPANFVDNKFEKELYSILKILNEKMAILMVSHDIGTITSHVKSILCVNKYVHLHNSNKITAEQLTNYDCPIQLVHHGDIPHIVVNKHQ